MLIEITSPNATCRQAFCCCDLDPDPMIITYESDLHILNRNLHTKNELSR